MDEAGPYKVIDIPGATSASAATTTLNTEAKDGWEVVGVGPMMQNGQPQGLRIILKKKQPEPYEAYRSNV